MSTSANAETAPPIGLEVSRKQRIGCLVFLAIAMVGFYLLSRVLHSRGIESARASSTRVYELAKSKDYSTLESLGTKSVVLTLKEAEKVNGDVSSFSVLQADTKLLGRPSEVHVEVVRNGKPYHAVLGLLDSQRVAVLIEYPKEDWAAHREDRAIRVIAR